MLTPEVRLEVENALSEAKSVERRVRLLKQQLAQILENLQS